MRIPFLGRRRKSIATLRSSAYVESDYGAFDVKEEKRRNKTVSQLIDEYVESLYKLLALFNMTTNNAIPATQNSSSYVRKGISRSRCVCCHPKWPLETEIDLAGSRSTGNLELPNFHTATPAKGGSAYSTPSKERLPHARHTMFSSVGSLNIASSTKPPQQEKSKSSFLARVTSRPSLSARYSSADLKSSVKPKHDIRATLAVKSDTILQPHHITHSVPNTRAQDVANDRVIYTSPRTAPSPPNQGLAPPNTHSQSSLSAPNENNKISTTSSQNLQPIHTSLSRRQSLQVVQVASSSQMHIKPEQSNNGLGTSFSNDLGSSMPAKHPAFGDHLPRNSAAFPTVSSSRPGLVRIGHEKVTLSVANVLETELGVDVHDSEDESVYDDSYGSQYTDDKPAPNLPNDKLSSHHSDSSTNLPPLSASSDELFSLIANYPPPARHIEINSNSPLSVLIDASAEDTPTTEKNRERRSSRHPYSSQRGSLSDSSLRTFAFSGANDGTHTAHVLDRISEKSLVLDEDSPSNKGSKMISPRKDSQAEVQELQQSLKVQCARFDRLAAHLLAIIQRHQNEKMQFENQVTALEKEGRRKEREIKGLRWLLLRINKGTSTDGDAPCESVRVASLQSFLSVAASEETEVNLEYAIKLLARAGRQEPLEGGQSSNNKEILSNTDIISDTEEECTTKKNLRRTRTMPDLHHKIPTNGKELLPEQGMVSPPLPLPTPSPDVSGLGLGLAFPLPEPIALPSISNAILSAPESVTNVPALTTAPTAASGLSILTDYSSQETSLPPDVPPPPVPTPKSRKSESHNGPSSREKRMAREWRPSPSPTKCYTPAKVSSTSPASLSYANNLNRALSPLIDNVMESGASVQTTDLDTIYQQLMARTNASFD